MTDNIISNFNDLYQAGSDEIDLRNPSLDNRTAGSVLDTVLGAMSAIGDEVLVTALRRIADTFIDTAEGEALDTLAFDHFTLERDDIIQSVGIINFSRDNADAGDITIPIGTRITTNPSGSDDEVIVETTETVIITSTTKDASARALIGGNSGNVSANTLTVIKTALDDPTITANNDVAFAGGTDRETDPEFRDRIKKYLTTLRKGTVGAVEFGATFVGGVAYAHLDESTAGDGYITLYIADSNGNSNAALEAAVAAEMINWRAAGITVNVDSATIVSQVITMSLTYQAGVDTEAVKALAISAARNYRDSLNVGETLYISKIHAAVVAVEGIISVTVTVPSGNVAPSSGQIIRGGAVTVS